MALSRPLFLLLLLALHPWVHAQNIIVQQGFEVGGACPDWAYTGGNVNSTLVRTGARSASVGPQGQSNTLTFAPVTVTGYVNVQLSLYHASPSGSGPGMDTDEGAIVQVKLNGGAWTTVNSVNGWGDCSWGWTATGGCPGSCNTTMPNPALYNIPNGITTVEVRVCSTKCPGGTIGNFNRPDEGLFVDDVQLTTTSPVVSPGSGNLTWTGAVSTDWFDCRNWNPTYLPGPGWNVTVDQTAPNPCIVGNSVTTPSTGYCATLTVSTTGVASRKFIIDNGRSLEVVGLTTVRRIGTGADSTVFLMNNGSLLTGGLTVTGTNAVFRDNVAANVARIDGDLLLASSGKVNIAGATLQVAGDIMNSVSVANFLRTGSKVVLVGHDPQVIDAAFADAYTSLTVNKEADDATLGTAITVSGTLDLFLGRLFTNATDILTLKAGSTVVNTSNNSFVAGPMRKEGNTAFTFPTGKGSVYRPITISGNAAGTGTFGTNLPTNQFTAEYFNLDPQVAWGTSRDVVLDHISACEYWALDRTGAQVTSPFVRPSWDSPASCGVSLISDLRVARWTGSTWTDRGNASATGTTTSGSLSTVATQTAFGPWTLASVTAQNPLPIRLLSFTATPGNDDVRLDWVTLTEENNDHFTVERSANGYGFDAIAQLAAAGNSVAELHYTTRDTDPLGGLSYYRLRQTDTDGATTVSDIVPVLFDRTVDDLVLLPSANELFVQHRYPAGRFLLFDANARLVREGIAGEGSFGVPLDGLAPGLYLVRVDAGGTIATGRFMH